MRDYVIFISRIHESFSMTSLRNNESFITADYFRIRGISIIYTIFGCYLCLLNFRTLLRKYYVTELRHEWCGLNLSTLLDHFTWSGDHWDPYLLDPLVLVPSVRDRSLVRDRPEAFPGAFLVAFLVTEVGKMNMPQVLVRKVVQ